MRPDRGGAEERPIHAADHGEPLQREGRPGTVSQQLLEGLTIDTQLETKELAPDAGVHREPTVFSSDHVGGRIGVEEPLHAEPTHDTPAHFLGERGQRCLTAVGKTQPAASPTASEDVRRAVGMTPWGSACIQDAARAAKRGFDGWLIALCPPRPARIEREGLDARTTQ